MRKSYSSLVRCTSPGTVLKTSRRFELWHNVNEMIPEEERHDTEPARPLAEAVLITPPPTAMQDYIKLLEKSQDEANDYLFDAFCLDACLLAKHCRRWIIVHDREMPQWTNRETHVKLYTPEKYTEKFSVSPAPKVLSLTPMGPEKANEM